jgi:ADP-heptose:LPS heptosyltransferase
MANNGVTPVVLGASEERPTGAAIAKAEPRAKNLVTRPDLFQSIALAERASFAVGDDVDLMHVAAAAGAPCLVFLSSTTKGVSAPRGRSGVVEFTAAVIADLPVDQVDRQLRNCGVYRHAATA